MSVYIYIQIYLHIPLKSSEKYNTQEKKKTSVQNLYHKMITSSITGKNQKQSKSPRTDAIINKSWYREENGIFFSSIGRNHYGLIMSSVLGGPALAGELRFMPRCL